MADDKEIKPLGPITLANMKVIENRLYHSDSCTRRELQVAIQANVENRYSEKISERTIQNLIKYLNEWYAGKNRIGMKRAVNPQDGPIYTLDNRIHLRFPEIINECSEEDRDVLRIMLQIAGLYNLPVKKLADKISKRIEVTDSIDIQHEPFARFEDFFGKLFDAVFNRKVMVIIYTQKKNDIKVEKVISPLMLKCYNNRWYLIAHSHEHNPFDWSIFPLDRIERVSNYENEKKKVSFYEIKISRIKEYYSKVIGFDVPWRMIKGNTLEDPKRYLNPKDLVTTSITIKFNSNEEGGSTFHYIMNNPIHSSQMANTANRTISLNVVENDALYKKLIVIGADIESISPTSVMEKLQSKITKIYLNLQKRNQNSAKES